MRPHKTFRYLYYRCVRIHGRPREVAMGMAVGLAVGMTPTLGVQMVVAIALAALLGQSKVAAGVGVWISNPLTVPLIYGSTYTVGAWVLDHPLRPPGGFLRSMSTLDGLTASFMGPLWVGGALLAVPIAAGGYWLTYQGVIAYRLKVRHRRANRLHKWKWNPHDGWHRVSVQRKHRAADTGA
jgi:uncharacterized protein (DUF2062 family)